MENKTTRIFTSKLPTDHIITRIEPAGMLGAVSYGLPSYLHHAPPIIPPKNLGPTVGSPCKGYFSSTVRSRSEHSPDWTGIKDGKEDFQWQENYIQEKSQQSILPRESKTRRLGGSLVKISSTQLPLDRSLSVHTFLLLSRTVEFIHNLTFSIILT